MEANINPTGNLRNRWIEDLIGNYIGFVEDLISPANLLSQIAFYSYELLRQTDYTNSQDIVERAIDEFLENAELDEEMAMLLPNLLEILLEEINRLVQLKHSSIERWESILAEELEKKTWFGTGTQGHDIYYT